MKIKSAYSVIGRTKAQRSPDQSGVMQLERFASSASHTWLCIL